MRKFFSIAFVVVAVLTILEYLFIYGLLTGILMMLLSFAFGAVNVVLSIREKQGREAILYAISTIALCMEYIKLMF